MRHYTHHKLLTTLLCLALLLKGLVPVGFMPDLNALQRGSYTIVICTGHGPLTVQTEDSNSPASPSHHSGSDLHCNGLCPFAGGYVTPIAQSAIFLMAIFFLWKQVYYRLPAPLSRLLAFNPAWPRSPPLHSA